MVRVSLGDGKKGEGHVQSSLRQTICGYESAGKRRDYRGRVSKFLGAQGLERGRQPGQVQGDVWTRSGGNYVGVFERQG